LRADGDITFGDITLSDTKQIAAEVRAARKQVAGLSKRLAVSQTAVLMFLRQIGESNVRKGRQGDKLIEVARQYKRLEQRVEVLQAADPQMQWIRAEVEFALVQGDFKLADALLTAAVSQIKGVERLRDGDVAEALQLLMDAVAALQPYVGSNPKYSGLILQIGYILKTGGDALRRSKLVGQSNELLTQALNCFDAVATKIPSNQKTVADLAGAFNGIANIAYISGDPKTAIKWGELATTLEPLYAFAWHDLLGAYIGLAQNGDIHIDRMREVLGQLKTTATGVPGLDTAYLVSLEQTVEQFAGARGAANPVSNLA
jgi:tetratricopeptide (TPR) repeat protein